MSNTRNLCVIPARGGSKRIPRKNIREFCGKPIIVYSIEAAQKAACFDRIIVSTDDDEIAEVAECYGADIPFTRPAELANDYAGTTEVIAHAVGVMEEKYGSFDAACCLYATAPFVQINYIVKGLEVLQHGWSFVFPVAEYPSPIFRSFRRKENGAVEMFFPEHFTSRSQDLETAYHDAGQFYWGKADAWKNEEKLFAPHTYALAIPRRYVQDIDTEEDWLVAKYMYEALQKAEKSIDEERS